MHAPIPPVGEDFVWRRVEQCQLLVEPWVAPFHFCATAIGRISNADFLDIALSARNLISIVVDPTRSLPVENWGGK